MYLRKDANLQVLSQTPTSKVARPTHEGSTHMGKKQRAKCGSATDMGSLLPMFVWQIMIVVIRMRIGTNLCEINGIISNVHLENGETHNLARVVTNGQGSPTGFLIDNFAIVFIK